MCRQIKHSVSILQLKVEQVKEDTKRCIAKAKQGIEVANDQTMSFKILADTTPLSSPVHQTILQATTIKQQYMDHLDSSVPSIQCRVETTHDAAELVSNLHNVVGDVDVKATV